jgi:hypothetical protein
VPRPAADFARYGPELRRVRAGERRSDDGGKSVWHQAAAGIEVISLVDENGRAVRQECYLEERAVVWAVDQAVSSAQVQPGRRAGEALSRHARLDGDALGAALAMLQAAPAGDRYLDHLRAELEAAARGLAASFDDSVTVVGEKRPSASELDPNRAARSRWIAAAIALAVLAGALLAWRALH